MRAASVYLIFVLCLSLLLALGGWQWRRGLEKAAVEQTIAGDDYITVERAPRDWSALAYRRVRLHGRWLDKSFLLANRVHRGRVGYEVLTMFELGDGAVMLVNRGWVGDAATVANGDADGANGDADGANGDDTVAGHLYLPQAGFTLGDAVTDAAWPVVIQYFDAAALSAVAGVVLQPAAVALAADHPAAFARVWRPTVVTAARHYAYAAQWWALAATLAVFGVVWRRQRRRR